MARRRSPLLQEVVWRFEAAAFDLYTAVSRALPIDAVSAGTGWLARAVGPLTRAHRTALLGLRIAFPEMNERDRAALAIAQWENFGRYIGEFPVLDRLTMASGRVEVVGYERLLAIGGDRASVVFISGHLSNLEVMSAVIVNAGIPCDITYRAANNPHVDRRIKRARARYGVTLFAPKGADGARELLAALGAGRSVAMMNDQKYDGGVEGVFFGRPVRTNPAAARLARRFGATIQPLSVIRLHGARFRLTVHEPIAVEITDDRGEDVDRAVDAINSFIEDRVRERPHEWWWMHRRWPSEVYAHAEEQLSEGLSHT